ncbi:MAG: DUF308 domain-containing protein [Eubacteriales bacterium]|nr:DUF308 domain-containing protein [Eubacteriales bacterium]
MQSESFSKFIKSIKTGYIILSVLFCICGILILVNPGVSTVTLCYALGAIMVVFGIVKILGYFLRDHYRYVFQYDLAFGFLLVILGLIVLFHPFGVLTLFHTILGILFLTDGLFKIQLSIDMKSLWVSKWWLILVFALLTVMLGVLMILHPQGSAVFLTALLGISLLAEGILNLCTILYAARTKKYQQ